jgi:chorismate mutase/GNAT superfamily N-acetyltransferase
MPSDARAGTPTAPDLTVRPGTRQDADALATLYLQARAAAYPAIPHTVHPPDDVRRWWRSRFDAAEDSAVEVWVAERDQAPVGLLLLEGDWLHSLYVAPGLTGQGIGTLLLDVAQSLRPGGLGLWVFARNVDAQRFYRRHGFVEVRRTDGSDNEEREPDVEMAWPDPGSMEGMRRRVDAVDDRLAGLLAERARLTARIQRVKAVPGHAGRDRVREAEIVERMARRAPELGAERLARIMDAVITESLDAAEQAAEQAAGQAAEQSAEQAAGRESQHPAPSG